MLARVAQPAKGLVSLVVLAGLVRAIVGWRRQKDWITETNRDYAALKADPEAWAQELAERAAWDVTLLDGLENSAPRRGDIHHHTGGAHVRSGTG